MRHDNFAKTPKPPYYAEIFCSQRYAQEAVCGVTADRMVELAAEQNVYLGLESVRGTGRFGITGGYWQSEDDIKVWERNAEDSFGCERGHNECYEHFELPVARLSRAYDWPTIKE